MHQHFEGTLGAGDTKRHIPHRFHVPPGSGRLELELRFAPLTVDGRDNLLTLTLFDPAGFRGAGHRAGAHHRVSVASHSATPGYVPGLLPPGEWLAQLDTHLIMPGAPVHYGLDVRVDALAGTSAFQGEGCASRAEGATRAAPPTKGRGPGWYRGELHSHSAHSDGDEGFDVPALVEAARAHGLDFIFLTDHNTVTGLDEMAALASPGLLTCGGLELTTFWGHALCLGAREWVDWRARPGDGRMAAIAAASAQNGHAFIIAHPRAPGDPLCTGCTWLFDEVMPGPARLVEVWNGPWGCDSDNESALALWYGWLNQGLRVWATAGSDLHAAHDYAARPGLTVIYAQELTEAALLAALRAGRAVLSAGPRLEFEARGARGERATCGGEVSLPATFGIAWAGCPTGAHLRLIADGRALCEWAVEGEGRRAHEVAPGGARWVLAELRDERGEMLALSNPVWIGLAG